MTLRMERSRWSMFDKPVSDDLWAPGGKYDTSTVTLADRTRCFMHGHEATYGSLYGWCERCKHTVWTRDRKSVLYHGEYHRFPPAHDCHAL